MNPYICGQLIFDKKCKTISMKRYISRKHYLSKWTLGEIKVKNRPFKLFKIELFVKNFPTKKTTGPHGFISKMNLLLRNK